MNSSTAATLPLLQTSSKNLRTSFLLFSWVSDTGASPLSQPTLLYRIDTMHIRPPGGVTRIDGGLFTQVRGRGILRSSWLGEHELQPGDHQHGRKRSPDAFAL